mmetsp:Transcript_17947/g.25314  ORF Transcript_17947/g.25314 Transcript_17947/m.25314 type:complete len:374 (-) Transcript_17947:61-1182(-)
MFLSMPHQVLRHNQMACSSPHWKNRHPCPGNGHGHRRRYRNNKCMRMSMPSTFSNSLFSHDCRQEYHFSESNNNICLSIDLPGVKSKDLNVVFENDTLYISASRHYYQGPQDQHAESSVLRRFAIDGTIVDTSNFKANLADGVLVVTAPKKAKEEDRVVPITTNQDTLPANEKQDANENDMFEISVDVPGVKSADLKVEVIEDGKILRVAGHRKGRIPFVRLFSIDNVHETIDTLNLQGNLSDGVLVLRAPKKTKTVNEQRNVKIGIDVTTHEHEHDHEQNTNEEDGKMQVENDDTVEVNNTKQQEEKEKKTNDGGNDKTTESATSDATQVDQDNGEEKDIEVGTGEIEVVTVSEKEATNTEDTWEEIDNGNH